mgnify:CR=1 FL=1
MPHSLCISFICFLHPGLRHFAYVILFRPLHVFCLTAGCDLLDVSRDHIHCWPFPIISLWSLRCVMAWLLTHKTMHIGLSFVEDWSSGLHRCHLFFPSSLKSFVVAGLLVILPTILRLLSSLELSSLWHWFRDW